jgi:thiamine phosphate synthase YjbQ (UPF0047 family)
VDGDEDAKQALREMLNGVLLYQHDYTAPDTPEGNICMRIIEFHRVVPIEGIKLVTGVA